MASPLSWLETILKGLGIIRDLIPGSAKRRSRKVRTLPTSEEDPIVPPVETNGRRRR